MPLQIAVQKPAAETAVAVLTGTLTLGTDLKVAATQLQTLVEQGVRSLVLDMTGVAYSDSAGLGMLIHTFGLLEQRGGAMRLCGVGERVAAMLRMTHTDKVLPTDPDLNASLAALSGS